MLTRMKDEAGFSLVELTVAMVIGLLVIGAAYMIFDAGMRGYRIVDEDAQSSSDSSFALHVMSRYLRETEFIDLAGDREIKYRADADDDSEFEEVRYYMVGTTLYEDLRELDSGTVTFHHALAYNVRNTGRIFTYWKAPGVETAPDPTGFNGERLTKTKRITIELKIDVDPAKPPVPFTAKTEVALRNPI